MTETEFIKYVRCLTNELGVDYGRLIVDISDMDRSPAVTITETTINDSPNSDDDERGTLIHGPWDEPYTALQRVLARATDWLAEAHVNYQPDAFFEIHLLGGVLKVRENGDVILNVMPLTRGFKKLFNWMWNKGLP